MAPCAVADLNKNDKTMSWNRGSRDLMVKKIRECT
jgi:hypothetical protein